MEQIALAIVGCGGMGHRHLEGLAELHRAGLSPFRLVGACDPVAANAGSLAAAAERHFGVRPATVPSLEELAPLGVQAVDVTTSTVGHHTSVAAALERGWHVMVEKPLGVSVAACRHIRQCADRSGLVVSVAENYRRDPLNRLARALIDAGAIGAPRFYQHNSLGGSDVMFITVWRHRKEQGGLLVDAGVHDADMMEYLCGPVTEVYAQARLHEPERANPAAAPGGGAVNPAGVYGRWQRHMPERFAVDAEDAVYATLRFANGAAGQYVSDHASRGLRQWRRALYGSEGAVELPPDRSGHPFALDRNGERHGGGDLLEWVPEFRLEEVTARLFGGELLVGYELEFPAIDRKLIAVEYAELARAAADGAPVEVDVEQGMRAVAVSYAMLESAACGKPVTVEDVMTGAVRAYQEPIDDAAGLCGV
ncbi:MAG: Gfo/Idh/MocA family oxidoreductase [Spirochaetaceae bacterium]|nr:Gfo/Idh/MocA family oxidoreductase [Spirochaetaceae bacterium]